MPQLERLGQVHGVSVRIEHVRNPLPPRHVVRRSPHATARGFDQRQQRVDVRHLDAQDDPRLSRLAGVLAAAVRAIGDVDVVLAGDSSVDVAEGQVAMTLAGELGWLGLNAVSGVTAGDGGVVVERDLPSGVATLAVTGPVVLAASSDAVVARVPGMKDILGAAKKPVELVALTDLAVPAAEVALVTLATAKPDAGARQGVVLDGADPAAAVAELVGALRQARAL